jgi:hypothetical protein
MALLTRAWPRSLAAVAVVCLAAGVMAAPATGQIDPSAIEANVKAVFLFNFTKYVAWPSGASGDRSPDGVRICVTANDEFFARLKTAVQGEEVDGKPLVPIALQGLDEAKACQILYVGDARSADGKAWLTAVRGQQILTVADGPLNDDTVIAFVRDSSRIRFDINRASAGRRNLNVSAKLLRLARQVKDR